MKYTRHPYEITKAIATDLEKKKAVFLQETKVRSAIHITMVTTWGLSDKGYRSMVQSEVELGDLFSL